MTKRLVVSDSSTLILMVKASFVDIIVKSFRVFVPKIVFEESTVKGKETGRWDALKIEKLVDENLIKVKTPSKNNIQKIEKKFNLHKGELHAIALTLDMKAGFLLTDDLKAMNACKILNIKFVNAISLLLSLYEKGKLTQKAANECFTKLEEFGWYSPSLINEFRKKLKEVKK